MRDAGWGPALPHPARARAPAHYRRPGLRGVSRALSGGGARAPIERAGVRRAVLRSEGERHTVLLAHGAPRFGVAWVALCIALGIHVADEALSDFLSVYNPAVRAIRARLPFLPLPTFTFRVWLAGLVVAVLVLTSLTPFAFRQAAWIRPIAYAFGIVMAGNGLLHLVGSAYMRKAMPGVYSAPLLLAAAIYLLASA